MSEKTRIAEHSRDVFFQYGIRSVTMDDLARELGISKKTLYQHFKSKDELVGFSIHEHLEEHQQKCIEIFGVEKNAIEKLLEIAKVSQEMLRKLKPSTIYDLQKYHKKSWDLVEEHRSEFIPKIITGNIQQGIKEGLYRENVNATIISKLYLTLMKTLTNSVEFPPNEYPLLDVYIEFTRYHIYGIASDEGIKFLKKIQKNVSAESV